MELQRAADRNDMKGFYSGLKEVWGPEKKGPVQLKSTDGMETFSDKTVVARWSEHFHKLLNVPGDIDHEALDNIPQRITKTSLDEIPTMDEMARAIAGLKDGKAPGPEITKPYSVLMLNSVLILRFHAQRRIRAHGDYETS